MIRSRGACWQPSVAAAGYADRLVIAACLPSDLASTSMSSRVTPQVHHLS